MPFEAHRLLTWTISVVSGIFTCPNPLSEIFQTYPTKGSMFLLSQPFLTRAGCRRDAVRVAETRLLSALVLTKRHGNGSEEGGATPMFDRTNKPTCLIYQPVSHRCIRCRVI